MNQRFVVKIWLDDVLSAAIDPQTHLGHYPLDWNDMTHDEQESEVLEWVKSNFEKEWLVFEWESESVIDYEGVGV